MNRSLLLLLLVSLLAVACGNRSVDEAETAVTPTTVSTVTVTDSAEATPTPDPTPTPAPTPTAEPFPTITVSDQTLDESGELRIDAVYADEPGWVAVIAADRVIGSAPLAPGLSEALDIVVDPYDAAAQLTATLFAGPGDTFDMDEAEVVVVDGELVSAEFDVALTIDIPELTVVDDQVVLQDGVVTFERVSTPEDAWVVVYNQAENGDIGWDTPLGAVWVEAGAGSAETAIRWRGVSPHLVAVLHEDGDRPGRFDGLETDPPFSVGGKPVAAPFDVTLPPFVMILDQPITDANTVLVERAVSHGPGWVTILHATEDGGVGNIIGFAPLEDGVNTQVPVEIVVGFDEGSRMFAQLHQDTGEAGEFEYPNADPAVFYQDQAAYFTFGIDPGNYVIVRDQPLSADNTITVAAAIGDVPMWVTVRGDDDGRPGPDVLGLARVDAGVTVDIPIEVDPDAVADTLHIVLHQNVGEPGEFEWPDGLDLELQRRSDIIHVPFTLFLD